MNEFLNQHFKNIMDYNFTADVEKELDSIAKGELQWTDMLSNFYSPFHKNILHTKKMLKEPMAKDYWGMIQKLENLFL